MGGDTVVDSWFNLWRTSRKSLASEPEKAIVGILSFEVSSLMSKLIRLWQCLGDRQIVRVREDIVNSFGIQKLVSDDEDYLMELALAEMIETLRYVGKSVAVLGKKCVDPTYHHLEAIFNGDSVEIDSNWSKWEYKLKKMERKIKKMERFVASTSQLYQELEVLAEVEQTLRRMQGGADLGHVKLLEFQQKVMGQRLEVKTLREMSPWVRSYDYIVRLLVRSIFTVIGRIQHVFGIKPIGDAQGINDSSLIGQNCLVRSNSISALMQSSVHPSENYLSRLYSGPFGRSFSTLGLVGDKNRSKPNKSDIGYQSSRLCGKPAQGRNRRFRHVGSFKGCMSGRDSPIVESCMPSSSEFCNPNRDFQDDNGKVAMPMSRSSSIAAKVSLFGSKHKQLSARPHTLGHAALALHYANVIILIEKLALSPHLISLDARDDLYYMLPTSVRTTLRSKLKVFKRNLASSVYDAGLASEWCSALSRILEWLSPLAHNMIRWHSDRNFERQSMISGTHVLLVQTLYFADQAQTEAAITELLLGLNYLSRFGQEHSEKLFLESPCNIASNDISFCSDSFPQHHQSPFIRDSTFS